MLLKATKFHPEFHPKLCGICALPQNFDTRKLGEITVQKYRNIINIKCQVEISNYQYNTQF